MSIRTVSLSVLLLVALAGCASTPAPAPSPAVASGTPAGEPHWWIVRVRMGWDDARPVAWHIDALLAEQWMHHLNAIYGYRPALIQERRLMRS